MLGKARARPDQVAKVVRAWPQQGAVATYHKVMNKLDSYTPLGYSLCGVVVEVGAGADECAVGDLVACAGNEFALHAELQLGAEEPLRAGAGRRAAAARGLRAPSVRSRCRASARRELAARRDGVRHRPRPGRAAGGAAAGRLRRPRRRRRPGRGPLPAGREGRRVALRRPRTRPGSRRWSRPAERTGRSRRGPGLPGRRRQLNRPVELAARLARDRARVVDIGKCRLDLPWNAYYEKELDVRFSRSYGPGRYDAATSSRASTTRSATCAGPSAATWRASST